MAIGQYTRGCHATSIVAPGTARGSLARILSTSRMRASFPLKQSAAPRRRSGSLPFFLLRPQIDNRSSFWSFMLLVTVVRRCVPATRSSATCPAHRAIGMTLVHLGTARTVREVGNQLSGNSLTNREESELRNEPFPSSSVSFGAVCVVEGSTEAFGGSQRENHTDGRERFDDSGRVREWEIGI